MIKLICSFILLICFGLPAFAQTSLQKKCFRLVNQTQGTVHGQVATAPDGDIAPQRMNFTLTPDGDTVALKVCSEGPFFEGDRLRLVLRTLMPVFECKTIAQGDVIVERLPTEDGRTKLFARCR